MVYHVPWYIIDIPWYTSWYITVTMVYHGVLWYTVVYHGLPWYTMAYHGTTVMCYDIVIK